VTWIRHRDFVIAVTSLVPTQRQSLTGEFLANIRSMLFLTQPKLIDIINATWGGGLTVISERRLQSTTDLPVSQKLRSNV